MIREDRMNIPEVRWIRIGDEVGAVIEARKCKEEAKNGKVDFPVGDADEDGDEDAGWKRKGLPHAALRCRPNLA